VIYFKLNITNHLTPSLSFFLFPSHKNSQKLTVNNAHAIAHMCEWQSDNHRTAEHHQFSIFHSPNVNLFLEFKKPFMGCLPIEAERACISILFLSDFHEKRSLNCPNKEKEP
jgi:hypothetical protein